MGIIWDDKQTDRQKDRQIDRHRTDRRTDGRTDGLTDERTDGRMDGRADGRADGQALFVYERLKQFPIQFRIRRYSPCSIPHMEIYFRYNYVYGEFFRKQSQVQRYIPHTDICCVCSSTCEAHFV